MGRPGAGPWRSRGPLHLGDVLLADHMLSRLDVPGISGDEDAAPLTAAVWLADVSAGFSLATVGLEVPVATCRAGLVRDAAKPGPQCSSAILSVPFLERQSQTYFSLTSGNLLGDKARAWREVRWRNHPPSSPPQHGSPSPGEPGSLTLQGGTRCGGRCHTPWGRVSACG